MRLFSALMPRETRFFALFNRHAEYVVQGGRLVADLMHELRQLAAALFHQGSRGALSDPERLKRLRAIIERARHEVETVDQTTVV